MKKKLLSVLLTFMMVLTLSTSVFADETSNIRAKNLGVGDVLTSSLKSSNRSKEEFGKEIKLDSQETYKVKEDSSTMTYKLSLSKDKSISLEYKTNGALFGIMVMSQDELEKLNDENISDDDSMDKIFDSIKWDDTLLNKNVGKDVAGKVELKLKKGNYAIVVMSTKGTYTVSPMSKATSLKSMSPYTINKALPGATYITGKGVAGAKVTVTNENMKTYTTTVKSDNTFKVKVPKLEEDDVLEIKMIKNGYGTRYKIAYVEYAKFSTFTVNQLKSTSTQISGKGKSGATVRAYVDGKKIGETIVKSDGTYSMKIKKQSSGRKILVKMYKTGYTTKSKTITVKKVFSKGLTVNSVKSTQKTITGKGSKGATVKAYVNNKQIGKATVKSNGTYSMKIKKQSKGKSITVKMSKSGYAISSKSIKVK